MSVIYLLEFAGPVRILVNFVYDEQMASILRELIRNLDERVSAELCMVSGYV